MASTINNNLPRVKFDGIRDESIPKRVAAFNTQSPIHMPLFFILAEKGTEYPVFTDDITLAEEFGSETFRIGSKYHTHASELLNQIRKDGGSAVVQRLLPSDAKKSNLTLVAHVDTSTNVIQEIVRTSDGTPDYDENGNIQYAVDASNNPVYVNGGAKVTYELIDTETLLDSNTGAYDFTPKTSGDVITYPILTVRASYFGAAGDRIGLRIWTAKATTIRPPDPDIVTDQRACMINLQVWEKDKFGTPKVQYDKFSNTLFNFMLKPKAINYKLDTELALENLKLNFDGYFGDSTVHYSSVSAMIDQLVAIENTVSPTPIPDSDKYLLDIFTGEYYLSTRRIPYYGFQIDTTSTTTVVNYAVTHYMGYGDDGTITDANETLGTLVESKFNSLDQIDPEHAIIDKLQYPFTCWYDSGFAMCVKKASLRMLDFRPDVHIVLGTKIVGEDKLDVQSEISRANILRSEAALYVESEVWSTPVTRVVLLAQDGRLLNSNYTTRVPTTFDLASKRTKYLSRVNGLRPDFAYDEFPNNVVDTMYDISNSWMNIESRNAVWSSGANYIQFADRGVLFFPAVKTVYAYAESVLVSDILMQIACDVIRQTERTWVRMTGNSSLNEDDFAKKSDEVFSALTTNRYGSRTVVKPTTYFTAEDKALGYSWTQDVDIYHNTMRTVANVNITVHRMTQLQQQ